MERERIESVQAVVDRVSAYQDGAPEETVEQELRRGFAEAGLEVSDGDVATLTQAIESDPGDVSAEALLA